MSTPTPPLTPSSPPTAPTRPEGLPERYWDAAKGAINSELTTDVTKWAAEEVRRNALPKTAADVKIELPKDFKLPEGMQWQFDNASPEYKWLQETAVAEGWTQEQVTKLVGKYAEVKVGSDAEYQRVLTAEREKLGANGTARMTAVETWLNGTIGPELTGELKKVMLTAGAVKALEQVISKHSTQGHASFRQDGREPQGAPGRVSEEAYNKMSQAEKWDYARQFDQKQFNGATR